jgi:hypothetical protein
MDTAWDTRGKRGEAQTGFLHSIPNKKKIFFLRFLKKCPVARVP